MTIKEILNSLHEEVLKTDIIIPLLYALGCTFVMDGHGSSEKGKDIIYETESTFKRKIYGAIVLKNDGDVRKNTQFERIARQSMEALIKFKDPQNPTSEVRIHELVIMTSYNFTPSAYEYICDQTWANTFPNVHVIEGDSLQSLIKNLIMDYNKRHAVPYVFGMDTFKNFCEEYSNKPIMEMPITNSIINGSEGETI